MEAGRRPLAFDLPVTREEAAREEIFLGLRLAEGVAAERIEAFVAATEDVRLWSDYEAWLAEGILERARRPRPLHRARLPDLQRGPEPLRVEEADCHPERSEGSLWSLGATMNGIPRVLRPSG